MRHDGGERGSRTAQDALALSSLGPHPASEAGFRLFGATYIVARRPDVNFPASRLLSMQRERSATGRVVACYHLLPKLRARRG